MDVIKYYKDSNIIEKFILTGLMFILILYGFADFTTYLGLLFMLIGGILAVKKEGLNVFNNYIKWPILTFFFFATLSLFYVRNYQKATSELGSVLEIVVPFFITFYIVKNRKEINNFMLISMLAGSFIIIMYAFYEYFILDLSRVGSLLGNANILGVYMVFVLPFIFINVIDNSNKKTKIIMLTLFILHFVALLFSGSRAAFLGVIFSLSFLIINKGKKLYYIILIIILLIPLVLPFNLYGRLYNSYKSFIAGNGDQRIYIWKNALDMIQLRPFTGVGIGQFPIYYRIYEDAPVKYRIFTHAHNLFLQVGAELGLIGLSIIIWLIYLVIKLSIINYRTIKNNNFQLALLSSLMGFMVQELFEFSITDCGGTTILVGIILGWYIGLLSTNKVSSSKGVKIA